MKILKNNKKMIFCLFQFLPLFAYADIPHYDIVEVIYNDKKYFMPGYFKIDGVLKNHDLCYYDFNGEYIGEVRDFILNYTNNEDSITLYSSIEKINIKKLNCFEYEDNEIEDLDDILKILNEPFKVSIKDFKSKFILIDAFHGNTGGFTYTPDLKETDNIWLAQYPSENLFCIEGMDICYFGFYTIKESMSKKEKTTLRSELEHLLSSYELKKKFWKKIAELYNQQVIMVGFCSC